MDGYGHETAAAGVQGNREAQFPCSGKQEERKQRLIGELTKEVREYARGAVLDVSDEEVMNFIDEKLGGTYAALGVEEKIAVADTVFVRTRRELSVLQPLADNPDVTEIMVNGKDRVFVEKAGRLMQTDVRFESTEELEDVIRKIAAKVHREVNELSPILDARLLDGSRVNAVYKNIALGGPALSIRRFPQTAITMDKLIAYGSITEEAAEFLAGLVRAAYNIFVSGGTSSGKTTFLNALSDFIPKEERIVTIEDSAELQILGINNLVRLECRSANVQGRGEVTMRQLIKSSLRMRPNRIIVGEVRGEEVLDMIQAMNTGHDGSLSTGHGNSPRGMLYRLEAMFLQAADFPIDAIRRQIAEGIDIMVHLGRIGGGRRIVLEIAEVMGVSDGEVGLHTLFAWEPGQGLVRRDGMKNTEKMAIHTGGLAYEL
ncbi:MAG: CpaF family protein [Clostridiales Family XIII bacterium]|jgi:pilus assembly protein CpaF|nr:CpaF family protein [Clostridiales Family XIII bacterium]